MKPKPAGAGFIVWLLGVVGVLHVVPLSWQHVALAIVWPAWVAAKVAQMVLVP